MRNFFSKKHDSQSAQPKSSDQYKFWVPPSRLNPEPLQTRNLSSTSKNAPTAQSIPSYQVPPPSNPNKETYTPSVRSSRVPRAQTNDSVLNAQFWMPPQQPSQSSHRHRDKEEGRSRDHHKSDRQREGHRERGAETDVDRVRDKDLYDRRREKGKRETSRLRDDEADRYRYYYSDTDRDRAQYTAPEKENVGSDNRERRKEPSGYRSSSRRDHYDQGDSSDGSRRKPHSSSHHRRHRTTEDYGSSAVPGTVPSTSSERPTRDDLPVHLPTKTLKMQTLPVDDLPGSSSETEPITRHRESRHRRTAQEPQAGSSATKGYHSSRQSQSKTRNEPTTSSSRLTTVTEGSSQDKKQPEPLQPSTSKSRWNATSSVSTSQPTSSKVLEYAAQESSSMSSHHTTLSLSRPGAQGTPPTTSSESPASLRKIQPASPTPVDATGSSWYQPASSSESSRHPMSHSATHHGPISSAQPKVSSPEMNAPQPASKVPSLISKFESLSTPAVVVTPASPLPLTGVGWKPLAVDRDSLAPPMLQSRSKSGQTEARQAVIDSSVSTPESMQLTPPGDTLPRTSSPALPSTAVSQSQDRSAVANYQSTSASYVSKKESAQVLGTNSRNDDRPSHGNSSYALPTHASIGLDQHSKPSPSPLPPPDTARVEQVNQVAPTSRSQAPGTEPRWISASGSIQRPNGFNETLPSKYPLEQPSQTDSKVSPVEPKWSSASASQDPRHRNHSLTVNHPATSFSSSKDHATQLDPKPSRGDSKWNNASNYENTYHSADSDPYNTQQPTGSRVSPVEGKGTSASGSQDNRYFSAVNPQASSSSWKPNVDHSASAFLDSGGGRIDSKRSHTNSYENRYNASSTPHTVPPTSKPQTEPPQSRAISAEPNWTASASTNQTHRQNALGQTVSAKQHPNPEFADNRVPTRQENTQSTPVPPTFQRSTDVDRLSRQPHLDNVEQRTHGRHEPSGPSSSLPSQKHDSDRYQRSTSLSSGMKESGPAVRPFQHPKLAELLSSAPSIPPETHSISAARASQDPNHSMPRRDREVVYLSSASRQVAERAESRPNVSAKPPSPGGPKSSSGKVYITPPSPGPAHTAGSTPSSRQSPASLLRQYEVRPGESGSLRNVPSRESYTSPRNYASPSPEGISGHAQVVPADVQQGNAVPDAYHRARNPSSQSNIPSSSPVKNEGPLMYPFPQSPPPHRNARPSETHKNIEPINKIHSQSSSLDYQAYPAPAWHQSTTISEKPRPTYNPPQTGHHAPARLSKETSQESILLTPSSLAPSVLKPTISRSSIPASLTSQERKKKNVFFSMFKGKQQNGTDGQSETLRAEEPSLSRSKTPAAIPIPSANVPISERKSPNKAVFTPFRYLTSRRKRTVSTASLEALHGTAANTVVGSPTASMHSQNPIQPPPLRDPIVAAQEWREEMGSTRKIQRPGVVFDVKEEPSEDKQRLRPVKTRIYGSSTTSNRPS